MEKFALIKSRVNLNRVNLGIALISDLKVIHPKEYNIFDLPLIDLVQSTQTESMLLYVKDLLSFWIMHCWYKGNSHGVNIKQFVIS